MKVNFKPVTLAVAVALLGAASAQAQNVKIAMIEGLSGPFGGVGQNQLKHFQYAAERFSGKGANSGVTVEIVPMDSKGSPQEALLRPGQKAQWKAQDQFTVTLGNAGGVRAELNGKPQKPFGPSGKVVRDVVIKR